MKFLYFWYTVLESEKEREREREGERVLKAQDFGQ